MTAPPLTAERLMTMIADPGRDHRPVSFWFLNHFLEEQELRRQIAEQDDKGFGGVMCHARDGLRTAYLEQGWEDALRIIIDECRKRGMHVWLYDENHYPSGIAGGKITRRFPDRTMLSLVPLLEQQVPSGGRLALPADMTAAASLGEPLAGMRYLIAAGMESGRTFDLRPLLAAGRLDWSNDLGEPAIVLALAERGYVTNPVNHPDYSLYPDYLDPEVAREFIAVTHGWYAERFAEHFGTTIKGIFTDNACAHFGHIRRCVPWSRLLGERFHAATGIAIETILPKLLHPLPGHREARLIFWRFFGDEFIRVFVGAINDWCSAHGLFSTGHYCLEDGMGEHVRQIGSYFEVMKHQNFNAVDQISTPSPQTSLWGIGGGEPLTACIRNTASAAYFYGSPRVLCEAFGCCGGWGFDLREMRRIGGHLAALGVDMFVPHGLYYSIAGTRKYECTPDHLHHPMWAYYRAWSDPASRLSLLTSGSDSLAEIAVLYPVTTLQATVALGASEAPSAFRQMAGDNEENLHAALGSQPSSDRGADAERVRDLYDGLLDQLSQRHVSYEIVAEDILQTGQVGQGGCLEVPARGGAACCHFKAIVLPGVQVLEAASLGRLQAFADRGGMVLCLGAEPVESYDPASGRLRAIPKPFLNARATLLGIDDDPALAVEAVLAWIRERLPQPISISDAGQAISSRAFAKDGARFYLLHNSTDQAIAAAHVDLRDPAEPLRIDLDQPVLLHHAWRQDAEAWRSALSLGPGESALFMCGPSPAPTAPAPFEAQGEHTAVSASWSFSTDRDNVLVLRRCTAEQRRSRQICTYGFVANSVPSRCRLLIDLEMNLPELHAGRFCNRLQILLNGHRLADPRPGVYLDRYIREVDATAAVQLGANELSIAVAGSVREDGHRLWTPMLVGDFQVDRENGIERITGPGRATVLGDWRKQGFPDFSGEGRYRASIRIPAGRRARLDLGDLANACEVRIDGLSLGRRVAPPWTFEVPPAPRAERDLEVRVINTPEPLFETAAKAVGLFGPVTLEIAR